MAWPGGGLDCRLPLARGGGASATFLFAVGSHAVVILFGRFNRVRDLGLILGLWIGLGVIQVLCNVVGGGGVRFPGKKHLVSRRRT